MKRIIIISMLFFLCTAYSIVAGSGTVQSVRGRAQFKLLNQNATYSVLKPGDTVSDNTLIRTQSGAQVVIKLSDGSLLRIGSATVVELRSLLDPKSGKNESFIALSIGTLFSTVQKFTKNEHQFTVATPTAVAGVRGTDFVTEVNKNATTTKVMVITGTVTVANAHNIGNSVIVQPLQTTEIPTDAAPFRPIPVTSYELENRNINLNTTLAGNNDPILHNNLGVLYYRKNRIDKAEKEFLLAIKLNPNYADAHNNLGLIYKSRGDYTRAIAYFDTALRLDTTLLAARMNRIICSDLSR